MQEAPLDTCDCPEIEELALDVRGILEQAYQNQGEVPPFSFDEFNVTLAIQMMSQAQDDCLGLLTSNETHGQLNKWGVLEGALPRAQYYDDQGNLIPGGHVQMFREATTSGRSMIYHATVNGEQRVFILRRNEDAEVTVEMLYLRTPIEEIDLNGEDPQPRLTYDPNLTIMTNPNGLAINRTLETDNGNTLQFGGGVTEMGETYRFDAETRLTYGLDAPVGLPGQPGAEVLLNGRQVELSAGVSEVRHANGDLLDRSYETGITLRDPDQALSFGLSGSEFEDDRYNIAYQRGELDQEEILRLGQEGLVTRPNIYNLDRPEMDRTMGQGLSFSGVNPFADPSGGEDSEEENNPLSYFIEGSGPTGRVLERLSFGLAHDAEERTSFILGDADLLNERYNLRGGTSSADTRFSFDLEESQYSGLDGTVLMATELETEDGTERELTFGITRDEEPRSGDITHTGSLDIVTRSTETRVIEDGLTAEIDQRTQYGIEASEAGTLTLTAATFNGETYNLQVQDGRSEEVGSISYQGIASLNLSEDGGYGLNGLYGSETRAIGSSEIWELGVYIGEDGAGNEHAQARLRLANSDGVFNGPCEVLDLEATVSSGNGRSPSAMPYLYELRDGRTFRCSIAVREIAGQRTYEAGISRDRALPNGGFMQQQLMMVTRPNGSTVTEASWGAEIRF